jgi:hypothetical protein
MYLQNKNGIITYPYTIEQLKLDNSNTTFPENLSEDVLNIFDVYSVNITPKPNDHTKNIVEGEPTLIDGNYYQNWIQTDASAEEISIRVEYKWIEIRELRNNLLSQCDWTQLSDISNEIKEIYTPYRQQLRDITNQSDPFSIAWPLKP